MDRRETIPKEPRFTISDFNERFPDDAACLAALMALRFPGDVAHCEKCQQDRKHYRIVGRPVFSCAHCGTQVSPMAATIFEKSATSLRLWFYAMYLMASTRCDISAKQIQRETGVTYKTAWRMFRQIRSLLSESDVRVEGLLVEMDESYLRPKRKRGGKRGRPGSDYPKQCVVGMVERKDRVVALTANNAQKETLLGIAKERILPESTLFTDEWLGYSGFENEGYTHKRINQRKFMLLATCTPKPSMGFGVS